MNLTLKKILQSHKLLLKSIYRDLKVFNWWQRILIFIFAMISITFSIINFNFLVNPSSGMLLLNWDNNKANGIELWRRIIMELSGIASFTGVLCMILITMGKISNYFWGILNTISYGIFAFTYGYMGEAQLNILFFLPMQFVGIYFWGKNLDETKTVKTRSLKCYQWLLILFSTCCLGVVFYYEIPVFAEALIGNYYFKDNIIPRILDSVASTLSVSAQILLLYRFWQQWIFWIAINCVQMAMYSGVAGYGIQINMIIMWSLFLINASAGLYRWIKIWRKSLKTNSIEELHSIKVSKEHLFKLNELDSRDPNISTDSRNF